MNTISAGPLGSRAAKAIGFIDDMIRYSYANAPIQKELAAKVSRGRSVQRHTLLRDSSEVRMSPGTNFDFNGPFVHQVTF